MIGDAVRVADITTKSYLNLQRTRASGEHLGLKGSLPTAPSSLAGHPVSLDHGKAEIPKKDGNRVC